MEPTRKGGGGGSLPGQIDLPGGPGAERNDHGRKTAGGERE